MPAIVKLIVACRAMFTFALSKDGMLNDFNGLFPFQGINKKLPEDIASFGTLSA